MNTSYEQHGFTVVKGLFNAGHVAAFRQECDALLKSSYCHPDNIRSRYQKNSGTVPERFDPVTDISWVFKEAAQHARLLEKVAECLDDWPVLFKDKLILKPPGAEGYRLHQDFAWWSRFCPDGHKTASVMVALDKMTARNGALEVFSPEPKDLLTVERDCTDAEENAFVRTHQGHKVDLAPGDGLIFSGLCPHRSGPNASKSYRRVLIFSYNGASQGDHWQDYYDYYVARERAQGPQQDFW